MLQDANAVESKRLAQLQTHESTQQQHNTKADDHTGNAQFLSSMRTEVYHAAAESGLKDRLDQNRYYRQGAADLEGPSNFLRKEH